MHAVDPALLRRTDGRAWFAKFVGEPAIDDGGLFRESYSAMSEELRHAKFTLLVLHELKICLQAMFAKSWWHAAATKPKEQMCTNTGCNDICNE